MILNFAKDRLALILAGSITNNNDNIPGYFIIGTGSATMSSGASTLTTASLRKIVTSTTPTTRKVSWQGDFSSVEMSGLNFSEFGITGSGAGITGSMWSLLVLPAVQFNGTNELRLVENWEVF